MRFRPIQQELGGGGIVVGGRRRCRIDADHRLYLCRRRRCRPSQSSLAAAAAALPPIPAQAPTETIPAGGAPPPTSPAPRVCRSG